MSCWRICGEWERGPPRHPVDVLIVDEAGVHQRSCEEAAAAPSPRGLLSDSERHLAWRATFLLLFAEPSVVALNVS